MMKRQFGSLTISPGETLESRRARRLGAGWRARSAFGCRERCQGIGGTIQRGEAKASPSCTGHPRVFHVSPFEDSTRPRLASVVSTSAMRSRLACLKHTAISSTVAVPPRRARA